MVSMVMAQGDFFREFFRSLFSANLFVTGVILTIGAFLLFYGAIYLFNATNLGKRLGFLVTGGALFGWLTITSMLFVIYAPRGPKPDNIEGLNAVEIRIIPITFLLVSLVLFSSWHCISTKSFKRSPRPSRGLPQYAVRSAYLRIVYCVLRIAYCVRQSPLRAIAVIAQDLELHRQVNLADCHAGRDVHPNWRKVEYGLDSEGDQTIGHLLGGDCGNREDRHVEAPALTVFGHVVEISHLDPTCPGAHLSGVGVVDRGHIEAPPAQPAVCRQGPPQVPCAYDGDLAAVGDPQLLTYPICQIGNRVTNAPHSVKVEMGQITSDIGSVGAGSLG